MYQALFFHPTLPPKCLGMRLAHILARGFQPQDHCQPYSTSMASMTHQPQHRRPLNLLAGTRQLNCGQRLGYCPQTANTPREHTPRAQYCVQPVLSASLCSYLTVRSPLPSEIISFTCPWDSTSHSPLILVHSLAPYVLATHAQPTCHVTTPLCLSCAAAHTQLTLILWHSPCPAYMLIAHVQPRCQVIMPSSPTYMPEGQTAMPTM